ncbi:unnamed protein product [Owenia fusiformis]|uniref:Uncharacterized protein n=1 Tax=Owenia fusiformis TaxID=6347 RepID=A0A8J1UJD7_OWEFU|nr:unnamed protein product [Owenia fusiformis]
MTRIMKKAQWIRLALMLLWVISLAAIFFLAKEKFKNVLRRSMGTSNTLTRRSLILNVTIPDLNDEANFTSGNFYMPRDCPVNITLFTVFHEGLRAKQVLQNNTLLNWMQLQRYCIRPVFYSNRPRGVLGGKEYHGWQHHPLSAKMIAHNNVILRELFTQTFKRHNSDFYMFAYADVLFHGDALLKTLSAIKEYVSAAELDNFFISGSGYKPSFYNNKRKLSRKLISGNDNDIRKLLPNWILNKPYDKYILEYFITTKDSFPWDVVPNLVVTTLAPDPLPTFWFPMYANKVGIATFDISNTIYPTIQAGLNPDLFDKKHRIATKMNNFIFFKSFQKYCLYREALYSHSRANMTTLKCFKLRTRRDENGTIAIDESEIYSDQSCNYKYPIMIPMLDHGDSNLEMALL